MVELEADDALALAARLAAANPRVDASGRSTRTPARELALAIDLPAGFD
jgi:hypothetical protein